MGKQKREIKRYTNRKLYDTEQSRYVTLDDIAKLVRDGEEVRVIDNVSQEDLTSVTFAQIILEEEKRKTNLISVPFLRGLIRSGEAAVQDLSDRANRGLEAIGEITEKASGRVREVVEEGGRAIDEAIDEGRAALDDVLRAPQKRLEEMRKTVRQSLDRVRQSPALQREIERLEKNLHSIEEMVRKLREQDRQETAEAEARNPGSAREAATSDGTAAGGEDLAGAEPAEYEESPLEPETPAEQAEIKDS